MTEDVHDWLVFHRLRLNRGIDGTRRPQPTPDGARIWRFAPMCPLREDGTRNGVSDHWGGFGVYDSRAAAEAVFDTPEAQLPLLAEATEAWHAILQPFAHRGRNDWSGTLRDGDTIRAGSDPGGPLVVITSAGYEHPAQEDPARIANFQREIDNVMAFYATLPGLVRQGLYSGGLVDGRNGLTFSIWSDDETMMAAAYKAGHHRSQMDFQRTEGHFDYSSFSRLRIVASKGTWDGADPALEAA